MFDVEIDQGIRMLDKDSRFLAIVSEKPFLRRFNSMLVLFKRKILNVSCKYLLCYCCGDITVNYISCAVGMFS